MKIIAYTLSQMMVGDKRDPMMANETHIPVYGRNNMPMKALNFKGPNFGTNHSFIRDISFMA
jgi:hypothetical protein